MVDLGIFFFNFTLVLILVLVFSLTVQRSIIYMRWSMFHYEIAWLLEDLPEQSPMQVF